MTAAEGLKDLPLGYTLVRPVIETAMGVKNAYEIAAASPRVAYMGGVSGSMWGDLGASIGYTTEEGAAATWRLYTGPILVRAPMTLRAKAIRYGYKESVETRMTITSSR